MPNKQNKKKGEKKIEKVAWAVCYRLHETCLSGDIPTFKTRSKAKTYIKELHKINGGFEQDHHIIKVKIVQL